MTGELQSATVFAGPSGVLLGAAEEALTAPVPIWVHEVPAPPEPLFNGAVPVGGYYNLGAECTTFSPQDKPFALGLPVPEGADASRLAVAVLAPASYTVDGPLSGELWEPVTGFYDSEENLFVVPMAALIGEGATVVLIDYPGIGLPFVPAPESTRGAEDDTPTIYYVRCVGDFNDVTPCGTDEVDRVQIAMLEAHRVYAEQGFEIPSRFSFAFHWIETAWEKDVIPYRVVDLRPEGDVGCHISGGRFVMIPDTIVVCLPNGGIPSDDWLKYTVRHQLFHAIQFGHDSLRSPLLQPRRVWDEWVVEGMADAAVESDATMRRTNGGGSELTRSLRRADVPLTVERTDEQAYPFETQDFWVHLLQAGGRNASLGELETFLEQGASTGSVATVLDSSSSVLAFGTLGEEYWGWVKNQVMEKTVTFDDALANPCQLELDLIGRGSDDAGDEVDISWPDARSVHGGLERLQAEAVKIEFTEFARFVTIFAEGGGGPDGLAYKVYLAGESGCSDPAVIPDSEPRTFPELQPGAVVYVVLASIEHDAGPLPPLYQVVVRGFDE